MTTEVHITDYDPDWPARYEEARARITEILGDRLVVFEHVGSTSVPGLAAKDIIDMMPGIATSADLDPCIEPMVAAGYSYCPNYEHLFPDRRLFRMGSGRDVTEHVHIVPLNCPFWTRHIAFRDRLRTHPEVAAAYEELKLELAAKHRNERANYTDAKTDFIEEQIRLALQT